MSQCVSKIFDYRQKNEEKAIPSQVLWTEAVNWLRN